MPSALTKAPCIGFPQAEHTLDGDRQDVKPPRKLHKCNKNSTYDEAMLVAREVDDGTTLLFVGSESEDREAMLRRCSEWLDEEACCCCWPELPGVVGRLEFINAGDGPGSLPP